MMLGSRKRQRPRDGRVFYKYSGRSGTDVPSDVQQLFVESIVRDLPAELCMNQNCLVQAYLPIGLKTIGKSAFKRCYQLVIISIPVTVEVIGEEAFFVCRGLMEVSLAEGLKVIGKKAFFQCEQLPKIKVPSTVTFVEEGAFAFCIRLIEVELRDGLEEIRQAAFACCDMLARIAIPYTVKKIGDTAFSKCHALRDVRMSEGMEVIGNHAFFGTSLSRMEIPASVESIGNSAFQNCFNLVTVELHANMTASFGKWVFRGCKQLMNISVTGESIVSACCFNECDLLVKHYGDNIVHGLKTRFQDLPVHSACYHSASTDADELRELIASCDKDEKYCADSFGKSPFHILVSSATKDKIYLLEVLLDAYPLHILGWKDKSGKYAIQYMQHDDNDSTWDTWRGMILQKWMIERLFTWGRDCWMSSMANMVQGALFDSSEELQVAIYQLEEYETDEAMSLLELWLWRMQMLVVRKLTFFSKERVDRVSCKSLCGADFVIPAVVDFLGIDKMQSAALQ